MIFASVFHCIKGICYKQLIIFIWRKTDMGSTLGTFLLLLKCSSTIVLSSSRELKEWLVNSQYE